MGGHNPHAQAYGPHEAKRERVIGSWAILIT
jgi:hypothetical protein